MSNTEAQTIFEKGRQTEIIQKDFNGIRHVLVPNDCTLKSMDHLEAHPIRIIASPEFHDVDGFAEYVSQFKEEGTRIFVDSNDLRFCTVFDCHAPGKPAWGDHSASLIFSHSHEWRKFKSFDGKKMISKEFAEFIEDHVAYITNDKLTGSDLLTMAQKLKYISKGEIERDESLHSGLRSLTIKNESTLKAMRGDKLVTFPEKLKLALRVFSGDTAFSIEVFVRYRQENNDVPFFWIKIPDAEGIQEAAFNAATDRVRKITGLPVLMGSYTGKSHKAR